MDYLVVGLLLFLTGNLIHLERICSKLQVEVKHIKNHLGIDKEPQKEGE